jgi:hypothetical protein
MKTGKLDEYAVKARLFPAFLTLLPLGICAAQFVGFGSAIVAGCSAFGGTALLSFVLAQWSRDAGKSKESALYERWGGKPTTASLRHRDETVGHILKLRRHKRLQRLAPDLILPSVRAEEENPAEADEIYDTATKVLIQRTRNKDKYHVLFQELIDYGFRRNTWGLKKIAVGVLLAALLFVAVLCMLGHRSGYNALAMVTFTLILAAWAAVVTPAWVHRAAKCYAERLFDALDEQTELDEPLTSRIELT